MVETVWVVGRPSILSPPCLLGEIARREGLCALALVEQQHVVMW